ncbi:protein scabrous-like isoform X2 [Frieseomelitta varia]|uniref:protein scabrous-like isoform X2 n=1 Tax=Frieseomelitta varia TaxID=561572 RepID=UPI001CB6AF5D|nr:protein scabrous-like isoform X2 [Frieseomelitta varia]
MRRRKGCWLLRVTLLLVVGIVHGDENVSDAIRSLREQVDALLDHRQQDYNALEASLKRAIEKNTELFVLKNEIKQLRKEVTSLRGGNGNEAKNERLRVRWLGSAVTELKGEIAEVLRTRNASEELAERSRMKGELALLKGDVAAVGRGIRNLGGRIAKIEAVLGTIRVDIAAVKERFSLLFRTCADIASQLSSIQIEVKSLRCESFSTNLVNSPVQRPTRAGDDDDDDDAEEEEEEEEGGAETKAGERGKEKEAERRTRTGRANDREENSATTTTTTVTRTTTRGSNGEQGTAVALSRDSLPSRRRFARKHTRSGYSKRKEGHRTRLEDRLKSLERKVFLAAQRRTSLEKRVAMAAAAAVAACESQEWAGLAKRVKSLERAGVELAGRISNVTESGVFTREVNESLGLRLVDSLRSLENAMEANNSLTRRELTRLGINAARKGAELSLTREELGNLRRTVQALSVSASKLQERSDRHEEAIDRLTNASSDESFSSFQQLEDRYHLIGRNLTGDCEPTTEDQPADGLRLLEVGKGGRPMLVFCREGWIVVARRVDGTLDFDRTWHDYSLGFGSPVSEYWIGNQVLHRLTTTTDDDCTSLRIDMTDIYGERWRAEYQSFRVESEETGYRLEVRGYSGNATDALSYQNGMAFSAKDRDMDASATHCARNYRGGWWFSRCQHVNLNGKYSLGLTWFRSDTNQWMSIASSEMSVRRNFDCRRRRRRRRRSR